VRWQNEGSFGFFILACVLAKNQMCLICDGVSFFSYGIQRYAILDVPANLALSVWLAGMDE